MARSTAQVARGPDLTRGWEVARVAPGAARIPAELDDLEHEWLPATVPGTVADVLARAGERPLAQVPGDWSHLSDLDRHDWWYRCWIELSANDNPLVLCARGLATLATVWIDGMQVLESSNMFLAHQVDLPPTVTSESCVHVRFASLAAELAMQRPRPRWHTRLVGEQRLRWQRTTLLGKIPGWSPPLVPIGPWRSLTIEPRSRVTVGRPVGRLEDGRVRLRVKVEIADCHPGEVAGQLYVGASSSELVFVASDAHALIAAATVELADAPLWWPHTHGDPARTPVHVELDIGGERRSFDAGYAAFRSVTLEHTADARFALCVNGVRVFCRGACWTPLDIATLHVSRKAYRAALEAARDAGINMLRVGGTMVYEDDEFYELCDELGILVWQDLMLANMDYPTEDAGFMASVRNEARQLFARLAGRPSVAVVCGGSEVEQQAAMLGWPRELWTKALFDEELRRLCGELLQDVPYWPSSPSGGTLPFHTDEGDVHYWGVGAYRRPFSDIRLTRVAFASECLAFANVPEDHTLDFVFGRGQFTPQHPLWKCRSPRDSGAAWDFDDVRDHYLRALFGIDPSELRSSDAARYLELSRVVTGELMAAVFAEWRRPASGCGGGLVWFFQDLWPGAGWGIRDSLGTPKAAFHYLRRAFAPRACNLFDEGLNGLRLCLINDRSEPLETAVAITLDRFAGDRTRSTSTTVEVPAHATKELDVDAVLGTFLDTTYAYRFGPPTYELIHATMTEARTNVRVAEAFHFPLGHPSDVEPDIGLTASLSAPNPEGGELELRLDATRFTQAVSLSGAFAADDNFFHIAPGASRTVRLTAARRLADRAEVTIKPLNAEVPLIATWSRERQG